METYKSRFKSTSPDKIEKWLLYITKDKKRYILHRFQEIIGCDPLISAETAFLILAKKGLINTDEENLSRYKGEIEAGLSPSCLNFSFIISTKGYAILDTLSSSVLLDNTNNQLKLDI